MSFAYPPRFKGKGPGLVPKVSTQAGKLLKDDGTWATQALELQGEVAGGSIAAATGFDPGDFFYINASGGGFTAGNWAISDGTSWIEVDSIAGLLPAASQEEVDGGTVTGKYVDPAKLHGYVDPQLAAKSRVGRIISDAVTTNRRIQLTPGDVGAVGGLPVTILADSLAVPTGTPSASRYIFYIGPSSTLSTITHTLWCYFGTTNGLVLMQLGAGGFTEERRLTHPTFRTDYSGQVGRLSFVFAEGDSTSPPVITWNGVDITADFTAAEDSPAPNWMAAGMTPTHFISGFTWGAYDMPRVLYGIGAMSTDEVAAWHRDGTLPAWMERPGSAVGLATGTATNGSIAFDVFTGASATGVTTLEKTTSGLARFGFAVSGCVAGQELTCRLTITRDTGSLVMIPQLRTGSVNGTVISTASGLDGSGTYFFRLTPTSSGVLYVVFSTESSGQTFTGAVSDFAVWNSGLLDKPVVQAALATSDQFGRFSRLIVGGLPVPGSDHGNTVTIYGNTSTDGAQLLGGPIVSNANDIVLDHIEQSTATGTPTTKLGASAGAETYKASGALSAGLNVFTPVTRKLAGTSVYIGSTDGTKVRTILHGHKASVPAS